MKQVFITTNGKLIIEKDTIFIKNYSWQISSTIVLKLIFPLAILIIYLIYLFRGGEGPQWNFRAFVWGVFVIIHLPNLFEMVALRSYNKRIPLRNIVSYKVQQERKGLETIVRLKFRNGRYRQIHFRTLEKQFEPFIAIISAYITEPLLS